MKALFILAAAAVLAVGGALAQTAQADNRASVNNGVRADNGTGPASPHPNPLAKGDSRNTEFVPTKQPNCEVIQGASVTVLGIDPKLGALVRYDGPLDASGTLCPNHALMFIPVQQLAGWPAQGAVARDWKTNAAERAAAVQRLLAQ